MPDRIDFEGLALAQQERAAEDAVRLRFANVTEAQYRRMILGDWNEPEIIHRGALREEDNPERISWHTIDRLIHDHLHPAPVPLPDESIVLAVHDVSPFTRERVALEQAAERMRLETMTQRIGYAYATPASKRERKITLPTRLLDSHYATSQIFSLSISAADRLQSEAWAARGDEVLAPKRGDVTRAMEKMADIMSENTGHKHTVESLRIPGRLAQHGFDEVALYIVGAGEMTVYYDVETDDYFIDSIDNMKKKVGYK